MFVCLSIHLPTYLPTHPPTYLSVCVSVCMSVTLYNVELCSVLFHAALLCGVLVWWRILAVTVEHPTLWMLWPLLSHKTQLELQKWCSILRSYVLYQHPLHVIFHRPYSSQVNGLQCSVGQYSDGGAFDWSANILFWTLCYSLFTDNLRIIGIILTIWR
jgi:hypothetical protein